MPGWLRSKLMEQPPATPVTDLQQLPAAPYTPSSNYTSQNYRNFTGETTLEAETSNRNQRPRIPNTDAQAFYTRNFLQSQLRMPTSPYMPVTRSSGTFCYTCGYSNHRSRQCSQRGRTNNRGNSFPFKRQSKN